MLGIEGHFVLTLGAFVSASVPVKAMLDANYHIAVPHLGHGRSRTSSECVAWGISAMCAQPLAL
jgi:hypothetical protein